VPWFPRHAQDLDKVVGGRSYVGEDILVADHPVRKLCGVLE